MNAIPSATPSGPHPSRSARRRGFALGGIAAALIAVACGDPFLHLNPYDPDFPLSISIAGPDTLFSVGEVGSYVATFNPAVFADSAVTWLSDTVTIYGGDSAYVSQGSVYLRVGTPGNFKSLSPPLEPAFLKITVEALAASYDTLVGRGGGLVQVTEYRHTGFKSVILTQRVTKIQLRCPTTHTCAPLSVGSSGAIWIDGFDALGQPITALTDPTVNPDTGAVVATYVSRDPTIASVAPTGIRAATVTGVKAGSTWIVAMRNSLRDSLQLVVH
jgi:hypothetical protein